MHGPSPSPLRHLAEPTLAAGFVLLCLLALFLPPLAQPAAQHHFADQRAWAGLPHALDVLSNLGFAVAAAFGSWLLMGRRGDAQPVTVRALAALFFSGLACSAIGSAIYHWAPDDIGLAGDRLAMSMAFAGMLGLAAQSRISDGAGRWAALAMLLASVSAVLAWLWTGNVLPWALAQGSGMLAVLGLSLLAPRRGGLALRLGVVMAWYGAAKLLEWGDAAVFDATAGWVSGHSLKHVLAAGAAWPVLHALRARAAGTMATDAGARRDACQL
ncbi:MAG: hypothetical protein LBI66_05810 [Burkholderiaceae bacterium]|nr:hypothetical protein [Burkholderiaceae bacterium]